MTDIFLDSFVLAGGQYYDLKRIIKVIQINDELEFIPDDENKHDEYAVKVLYQENMIGYLSRTKNRIIYNMLSNNLKLFGVITGVDVKFPTHLEFDIYCSI
jgi:hypothetical protein